MSAKNKLVGKLLTEGKITAQEAIELLQEQGSYFNNLNNTHGYCRFPYCKQDSGGCWCNPMPINTFQVTCDSSISPLGQNED